MSDVTNPGLVNVANQAFKPALGVDSLAVPDNSDVLVPVADQGQPPAENGVDSAVFPTPTESLVIKQVAIPVSQDFGIVPGVAPLFLSFPVDNLKNNVANQNLTAGNPGEYTVAGPDLSIQTNQTSDTKKTFVVSSVRDADTLLPIVSPGANTTRYLLKVVPADLGSFGVTMLNRQIVFDDNIVTTQNEGATRIITGCGSNFIVIDCNNPDDVVVPSLATPQIGDTFTLDIQRRNSEVISRSTGIFQDITILPPPLVNQPTGLPNENFQGTTDVSTGPQPGSPVIASGVSVPASIDVNVSEQDAVIGLPVNVFP